MLVVPPTSASTPITRPVLAVNSIPKSMLDLIGVELTHRFADVSDNAFRQLRQLLARKLGILSAKPTSCATSALSVGPPAR